MNANDIERLENAARSVFGHEETDPAGADDAAEAKTPSLFSRILDYVQKRLAFAPPAIS